MECDRRVCGSCGQELAHSAYFRHVHDTNGSVCPGKRHQQQFDARPNPSEIHPDRHASGGESSSVELDSTFNFGSGDSEVDHSPSRQDGQNSETLVDAELMQSDSDDGDESDSCSMADFSSPRESESSSGEEFWEVSDLEDDQSDDFQVSHTAKSLLLGISIFLYFFHLFSSLSERAMVTLLSFFRTVFGFIGGICNNPILLELAQSIPKSLHTLRKYFRRDNGCTEYVVCPKCSQLYTISECIMKTGSRVESKRCTYIEFPHHPHQRKRSKCNTVLLKTIQVCGKSKLVPKKVFIYQSVISSLIEMAKTKDFLQKCEHWRNRPVNDSLSDIYDGEVWQDLQHIDGMPFLAIPNNLCLGMNIDWFNPYDESPYSVGAIYLVVLNLPRAERFKLQNVILVGMIPGPYEPEGDINTFLSPLVKDLKQLFSGFFFKNPSSFLSVSTLRAVLMCLSCDLPATRKVCGFSNFNGLKGCSKCLKEFPTESFGEKPNYGGFNWQDWVPRDIATQKKYGIAFKDACTVTARKEITRSHGVKYSVLLELPCFDLVRQHVVDPMHNVFLGLAKHTIKTWKQNGIINVGMYSTIQERVDTITPPTKLGRIPRKIMAGFSSFTADEWKHWILIYSLYALYQVVPDNHYKCWCLLVDSCRLLCLPILTRYQIDRAHHLLVEFCKVFESLYGSNCCTPNMHMACHLKESVIDFGPLSSFWCFPFERYNGTLQSIRKSWMGPERQMFTKFLDMQYMYCLESLNNDDDSFASLVCRNNLLPTLKASWGSSSSVAQSHSQDITSQQIQLYTCAIATLDATKKSFHHLLSPLKEKCFSDTEFSSLQEMYSLIYPNSIERRTLSRFYLESKHMILNNEDYITLNSRSQRSAAIAAHWPGDTPLRIGVVLSFFYHNVCCKDSEVVTHTIAKVNWYMHHPRRNFLHPPLIICSSVFDNTYYPYIPVARIAGRAAITKINKFSFDYGEDNILIAIPLVKLF